jgi:hypothetical protein
VRRHQSGSQSVDHELQPRAGMDDRRSAAARRPHNHDRPYSAIRALAEEDAAASPDVVDHVSHAWLCACGHISSDRFTHYFRHVSKSAATANRPQIIRSRAASPDVRWRPSRRTPPALGARPGRIAHNLIRREPRKVVPAACPVVPCVRDSGLLKADDLGPGRLNHAGPAV